jgi:phosphoglycolate phosphatase
MNDVQGYLFFDLDGTIADSGKDICEALDETMLSMGVAPLSDVEKNVVVGPPLQDALPPLLTARGIDVTYLQNTIDTYRAIYKRKYLPHTTAIAGMTDVVRELHSVGYVLSVVTTKPQPQAGVALRATGLMDCFVTVVGPRENVPTPKDELLRFAMRDVSARLRTTVHATDSWMIGDRHFDINAAHAVGVTSVAVMWGHGDEDEFVRAKAHFVMNSPRELLRIFL